MTFSLFDNFNFYNQKTCYCKLILVYILFSYWIFNLSLQCSFGRGLSREGCRFLSELVFSCLC